MVAYAGTGFLFFPGCHQRVRGSGMTIRMFGKGLRVHAFFGFARRRPCAEFLRPTFYLDSDDPRSGLLNLVQKSITGVAMYTVE